MRQAAPKTWRKEFGVFRLEENATAPIKSRDAWEVAR
jgi:hypothetical protein